LQLPEQIQHRPHSQVIAYMPLKSRQVTRNTSVMPELNNFTSTGCLAHHQGYKPDGHFKIPTPATGLFMGHRADTLNAQLIEVIPASGLIRYP
jgi:hypothetical protein